jgi:hypothetical protein
MTASNKQVAESILAKQSGAKKWGVAEHCAAIAIRLGQIMAEHELDEADIAKVRTALFSALQTDGLGGNASQFRQSLQAEGLIPKDPAKAAALDYLN